MAAVDSVGSATPFADDAGSGASTSPEALVKFVFSSVSNTLSKLNVSPGNVDCAAPVTSPTGEKVNDSSQ